MPRYVSRPITKAYVGDAPAWYDHVNGPSISVIVEDDSATDTGLLDSDGRRLYRVDRAEAGFWPHRRRSGNAS